MRDKVQLLCRAVKDIEGKAMPIRQAQIIAKCKVCEADCPALTVSWLEEANR